MAVDTYLGEASARQDGPSEGVASSPASRVGAENAILPVTCMFVFGRLRAGGGVAGPTVISAGGRSCCSLLGRGCFRLNCRLEVSLATPPTWTSALHPRPASGFG